MDGYAVCRALRHVDKKVPIVFVTAKGDLKDYTAGREAGGDSYLVKPIARAALRSIVNLFTSIERARPDPDPADDDGVARVLPAAGRRSATSPLVHEDQRAGGEPGAHCSATPATG